MLEKVTDLEQMSATHFNFCKSSLSFQKKQIDYDTQQLRLEQLYQSIKTIEVINNFNLPVLSYYLVYRI